MQTFMILSLMACDLSGLEDMFGAANNRAEQADAIAVVENNDKKDVATGPEEEEEQYTYNPNNKRDPFQSFLVTASEDSLLDNIPRTPLQKYEVGQYNLTGVIWGIDRPRALVEDPDGIGHVVEIGTYMGTKWGKVESIEEGVVIVTEELQTVDGQLVVKRQELRLESAGL
jgi:type IV pilus assembly protein PilP